MLINQYRKRRHGNSSIEYPYTEIKYSNTTIKLSIDQKPMYCNYDLLSWTSFSQIENLSIHKKVINILQSIEQEINKKPDNGAKDDKL